MNPNLQRILMGRKKASFSPLDLPNLGLFLASNLTSSLWADTSGTIPATSAVARQDDLSPDANHALQATSGNRPTTGIRTQNGLNVIDYSSTSPTDALFIPSGFHNFSASDFSFFMVAKFDGFGTFSRLIGSQSGFSIVAENSSNRYAFYNRSSFSSPAVISGRDTNPHIFYFEKSGSVLRASRDGVFGTNGTGDATTVTDMPIGSPGVDPFDGFVAEIIGVRRKITNDEINRTGSYLGNKWDLSWSNI